jgi:DNA-binding transcriptional ArsR family regulator
MRGEGDRGDAASLRRGLSHLTRIQIVRLLDGDDEPMSPKQAAAIVGLSIPNVGYHFRVLADLGLIRLVETVARRGATEHRYAITAAGSALLRQVLR